MGGIIFIVKYNGAFLRPPIPRNITGVVTKAKSEKVKFIDDGSVAVSIDLKSSLNPAPADKPRPLNYRERTCAVLPPENNLLQFYLTDTKKFYSKKTKVIMFNKSSKYDFPQN